MKRQLIFASPIHEKHTSFKIEEAFSFQANSKNRVPWKIVVEPDYVNFGNFTNKIRLIPQESAKSQITFEPLRSAYCYWKNHTTCVYGLLVDEHILNNIVCSDASEWQSVLFSPKELDNTSRFLAYTYCDFSYLKYCLSEMRKFSVFELPPESFEIVGLYVVKQPGYSQTIYTTSSEDSSEFLDCLSYSWTRDNPRRGQNDFDNIPKEQKKFDIIPYKIGFFNQLSKRTNDELFYDCIIHVSSDGPSQR